MVRPAIAGSGTARSPCLRGLGRVVDVPADELRPLADRLRRQYGMRLSIGHFALTAGARHANRITSMSSDHTHFRTAIRTVIRMVRRWHGPVPATSAR